MWVLVTWVCSCLWSSSNCILRKCVFFYMYIHYDYYVTNHHKLSGIKQWPFYHAQIVWEFKQQEWHVCSMISRKFKFLEVTWARDRNHLEASSFTCLMPGLEQLKGGAQLGLSDKVQTHDCFSWLGSSHSSVTSFQEESSWKGASKHSKRTRIFGSF